MEIFKLSNDKSTGFLPHCVCNYFICIQLYTGTPALKAPMRINLNIYLAKTPSFSVVHEAEVHYDASSHPRSEATWQRH
jgi:hypothetical protein